MRRWPSRSLTLFVLVGGGSLLPLAGSCQGGSGAAAGTTTATGTGAGGSTDVGLFDAGGTAWTVPDGCAGPPPNDGGDDGPTGCEGIEAGVTYKEVSAILAGCQGEGCHPSPGRADLVDKVALECCDGRLLVQPGNAARSYLLDKVEGHDVCQGGRMPLNQTPLPDTDALTLRRWICDGAPGP